ncbi:multicomponent Na+:H+ antiporter subunit B [Peptoclostridium litorale DSM 5388]|uniref:MrpA C-terminal/MbhE domain-containing protein n=1 Tax=Peptoclostridium litorale DSM 5388 TaxID=1121324 RepID=A0A069RK24_PEPLI|nr:hydrogen gas-evolving membrane-bound hydrogenase subunit E [Peptoclostridium litorale]KDR94572.1 hypothetical protein CLIT_14c00330 [Peptoclostridium litorale DSM 5388]SIO31568.1 multicomponent Na+:H+ antiporter subunit B [Peptoclostridium litorale DSM 5388]
MRKRFSVILTLALIALLLGAVADLPEFGSESSPAHNYVSKTYIQETTKETGALNIVTGIILDYRAFDTLIEASVIFTGVMVVMMLLKKEGAKDEKHDT